MWKRLRVLRRGCVIFWMADLFKPANWPWDCRVPLAMFKTHKFTQPATWSYQCRPQHQWRSHPPQERTLPAPQLLTRFPVLVKPLFNRQINRTHVSTSRLYQVLERLSNRLHAPPAKTQGLWQLGTQSTPCLQPNINEEWQWYKMMLSLSNIDNRKESQTYIYLKTDQSINDMSECICP